MKIKTEVTRDEWVDYAKAIGIILVVYGHVARGVHNAGIPINEHVFKMMDSVIYTFHMPLFFFLSGLFFLPSLKKNGGERLALDKINTIIYPYILWSTIQGLIEVALSTHTNNPTTVQAVFSLLWAPRAQFWFLYVLFLIFCIAALIYSKIKASTSLLLLLTSVILYLLQKNITNSSVGQQVFGNLIYFVMGVIFHEGKINKYISSSFACISLFSTFIASEILFHTTMGLTYSDKNPASLAVACLGITSVASISICLANRKLARQLLVIGQASMVIYLTHILASSGPRIVLKHLIGSEYVFLYLLIGCISGIVAPLIIKTIVDKYNIPFVFSAPIGKLIRK